MDHEWLFWDNQDFMKQMGLANQAVAARIPRVPPATCDGGRSLVERRRPIEVPSRVCPIRLATFRE